MVSDVPAADHREGVVHEDDLVSAIRVIAMRVLKALSPDAKR